MKWSKNWALRFSVHPFPSSQHMRFMSTSSQAHLSNTNDPSDRQLKPLPSPPYCPLYPARCILPLPSHMNPPLLCRTTALTRSCDARDAERLLRTSKASAAATSAVVTSARPAQRLPLASSQTVLTLRRSKSAWTVMAVIATPSIHKYRHGWRL